MSQSQTLIPPVTVEHTTSLGTTVRLLLEPAGEARVRILEYRRKGRNALSFWRVKLEEGTGGLLR